MPMEKFWVFLFLLNTVYFWLSILVFILQNTVHQRSIKCIVEDKGFVLLWGFKI